MSRPRANNRSTNFWAWFGQCLEKLGDMGSAMAPREAYEVESEKENKQKRDTLDLSDYGKGPYSNWEKINSHPAVHLYIDSSKDSILHVFKGDSTLFVKPFENSQYRLKTSIKNKL